MKNVAIDKLEYEETKKDNKEWFSEDVDSCWCTTVSHTKAYLARQLLCTTVSHTNAYLARKLLVHNSKSYEGIFS